MATLERHKRTIGLLGSSVASEQRSRFVRVRVGRENSGGPLSTMGMFARRELVGQECPIYVSGIWHRH